MKHPEHEGQRGSRPMQESDMSEESSKPNSQSADDTPPVMVLVKTPDSDGNWEMVIDCINRLMMDGQQLAKALQRHARFYNREVPIESLLLVPDPVEPSTANPVDLSTTDPASELPSQPTVAPDAKSE